MKRSKEGFFVGLDPSFSVFFLSGGAYDLDGVNDQRTPFSLPFRVRLRFGQRLSRKLVGA